MPGSGNNRDDQNTNREDSIGGLPPSIAQRLRDILIDEEGEDLLMQSSDDGGGDFRRWFEALDLQVIGACRSDERLKPLLKFNASNGVVEDRLLAHLSQHFEPSEVGLLARCLCLPLVSVRVGKIKKQGTLLSPTSLRGNLCLTLLPTSDMRISFNGDDGSVERLATSGAGTQSAAVEIEEISADNSGRSFLIKTTDGSVSYFWCCEKSKLLGEELLMKMKDFLARKLSLTELTGISESRLNYFASELRGDYLSTSATTSSNLSKPLSADPPSENSVHSVEHQSSTSYHETSSCIDCHTNTATTKKVESHDSLVSSSNLLKEVIFGNTSCTADTISPASPDKSLETVAAATNIFDDPFGKSPLPDSSFQIFPSSGLSPHYCWCPLGGNSSTESLPLPPLSSYLSSPFSTTPPNILPSKPTALNLADLPPLDFPRLLPPTSGHIPTFTPLMCDPIVHIPLIDVCSSGPGYLVSAGPSMSTSLSSDLMDPKVDPTAESSARETLRMLLSSSSNSNRSGESMQSVLVGSRGLYSGTLDVVVGFSDKSSRSRTVDKVQDSSFEPSYFDSENDRVSDDE